MVCKNMALIFNCYIFYIFQATLTCCSAMDMLEKLDILEQKLAQRMADLKKGVTALNNENHDERLKWNDLENTISDQERMIGEIYNSFGKEHHIDDVKPDISFLDSSLNESIKSKREFTFNILYCVHKERKHL